MRLLHAVSMVALLGLAAPAFADDYVVMKINNQEVSSSELQRLWEGQFPPGQAPALETIKPELRDQMLHALMGQKLLYAEALKQNVDKSDAVTRQIENVKRVIVIQALLDAKTADTITDDDVKKAYDDMVLSMRDVKEIRARHILLATEQEAKDAKKKLDSGTSFEDVARDYSKDPGSAKQGGDLGWFTKDKMIPAFGDAAFAMKKGETSGPVQSTAGWHIIQVEDIRKATIPTYNDVKAQLRAKLQEKKLNDYVNGLVKSADVKVYDAKGKEVPFDKTQINPKSKAK